MNALVVKIIIGVLGLSLLTGGVFYVKSLVEQNAILKAETQDQQKFIDGYKIAVGSLAEGYTEAENEKAKLLKMLAEHDLQSLAIRKPGLVERRINSATVELFNRIEQASRSGTPATPPG